MDPALLLPPPKSGSAFLSLSPNVPLSLYTISIPSMRSTPSVAVADCFHLVNTLLLEMEGIPPTPMLFAADGGTVVILRNSLLNMEFPSLLTSTDRFVTLISLELPLTYVSDKTLGLVGVHIADWMEGKVGFVVE